MYEVVMAKVLCFNLLAVCFYSLQLSDEVHLMPRMICRAQLVSARGTWNGFTYITSADKTSHLQEDKR